MFYGINEYARNNINAWLFVVDFKISIFIRIVVILFGQCVLTTTSTTQSMFRQFVGDYSVKSRDQSIDHSLVTVKDKKPSK